MEYSTAEKEAEDKTHFAETSMEGAGSANQPLLSRASRFDEDEESGACHNGGSVAAIVPSSSSSSSSSSSCSSGNSVVLFSSLVAVCGSYVFGNAVGYSSPAQTGIVDDLGLSLAEYSVFGSTLTIGAMVGAVPSGRVADLLGRRGAMWLSELFCITGWLAILFAKGAWWLDAGRLLMGCGIGLLSYVVPVYVAEIAPKNVRGVYTSLNQLMIGLGKAFMFLIGSLVSWRVLALIGTLPCLLQLLGLFFIPESPRWLAKVGREKEFEAALQRLRGKNANISQEASDIKDYMEHLRCMSEDGITELLQAKYAYPLIVGVGLMIIQQCGGLNGFVFYTSVIFEAAGFSATIGTVIAAVVQILSTTLGVLLIDKSGRRPLLLVSAAGGCLGCVFTGLSFFLQDLHSGAELVSSLVLVGVLVFLGSFELGMGGIPWIIMSEIFPINVKGSAGSFVNLVSWVGSWFVSYTFSYLFEWSSAGTFFIYAGICAVGVIFIAKLVPETKGQTLEEIHASITDKNDNNLS